MTKWEISAVQRQISLENRQMRQKRKQYDGKRATWIIRQLRNQFSHETVPRGTFPWKVESKGDHQSQTLHQGAALSCRAGHTLVRLAKTMVRGS